MTETAIEKFLISDYGYLLSGQVVVRTQDEADALASLPFPVPFFRGVGETGQVQIGFSRAVEAQDDILPLIEAGLVQVQVRRADGALVSGVTD